MIISEIDQTKERTAILKVSGSLTTRIDSKTGLRSPNQDNFRKIGASALALSETHNVFIVCSGAIPRGMAATGMKVKPDKDTQMDELQRLAGIGNRLNANSFDAVLVGKTIGSILLTRSELTEKREVKARQNLFRALKSHYRHGDIIFANEDDARSHAEIRFGDNDILAALSGKAHEEEGLGDVDVVLLGSDNGLLKDVNDSESVVRVVTDLEDVRKYGSSDVKGEDTNGGIASKFIAATILNEGAGLDMYWANGTVESAAELAIDREIGTRFVALAAA